MKEDEKIIQISYTNGNFENYTGEKLEIRTTSPTTIAVTQDGNIIFVGNVQALRYVKFKNK